MLEKESLRTNKLLRNCSILCFVFLLSFSNSYVKGKNIENYKSNSVAANRISGFIFDQNRVPISNVYVELQNELNQYIARVRTDGSGRYIFVGMSRGTYIINVLAAGTNYVEQSIRVQVVNFGARDSGIGESDDVTQDFYLQLRKKPSTVNFSPGVIFAQTIPKEAESNYNSAVSQLENENLLEGEKFLKASLNIFPEYFLALNRLGYLYFVQKKYVQASEEFAKAAQVNPKSEPTLYLLAYSVFLTKRYDTTIEILRGALGYNHETYRIYLLFGKAFRAKKDYQTAETALLKAEKLNDSEDSEVHWELATLYGNNLKQYSKAADQLELFLKLQPDSKDKKNIGKLIKNFREKAKSK